MPNHFTILYRAQEITNFEMEYIVDQSEERISKVQVVMKLRNVLAVFNCMISNEGKEIIVFNSTWIMRMYLLWDETKKKQKTCFLLRSISRSAQESKIFITWIIIEQQENI